MAIERLPHTTNRDELISTNRSFSLSPSVRKTTTQHRATDTELGTDTKPTLEVGGVPSLPRGESRAESVPSLPRTEPLAWSERSLCSSCGSSSSPWSTDTVGAPAWGGTSLLGGVARVPYSGTRGSANLPDTAL